jgi:hypothetical protein
MADTLALDNIDQDKRSKELAKIQGLSVARQRWLQDTLKVKTVQDLANLSVDQILSRLEADHKAVSRDQVEDWIDQAQALVAAQASWQPFATFVVSFQSRLVGGETQHRTVVYFLEADRRKIWTGLECDGVHELMLDQLQRLFQLEPAESEAPALVSEDPPTPEPAPSSNLTAEAEEVGLDLDQSGELLEPEPQPTSGQDADISQVLEPPPAPSPEAAAESPPTPAAKITSDPQTSPAAPGEMGPSTHLETMQLKLWQPPVSEEVELEEVELEEVELEEEPSPSKAVVLDQQRRSLGRPLQADQPLDLEVTFQLQGAGALALTHQPLAYHAQVYGQNRITGEKSFLGKTVTGCLVEGELTYTCRLANLVLPQSDAYQLQVITRLEGGSVGPDLFELSFVQVI